MLGKRSRPLLGITSKTSLGRAEDCDQKAVYAQAPGKLCFLPQHVTVGFDIPQETKPFDACESPRSVLEVNALPLERHLHGRSFRSCMPALPLRNRGSQGVGLAIIVDIHAEEKGYNGPPSEIGHDPSSNCHLNSPSMQLCSLHHHRQRSQPITIAMNCHSQRRSFGHKLSTYVESSRSKGDDEDGNDDDDDDDDSDGDNNDDKDESSSVGSTEVFGSDYMSPWQEYLVHKKTSCNADNVDCIDRPSIFSVASIPSSHGSYDIQPMGFSEACAYCHQAFLPGKDIFMYRGDQAFCSVECRSERIKRDDYKEKLMMPMYS